ncbi:MAG TPA: hypothetical protein VJ828_04830, partial [Lacipirellulaceae bacterium]|nr:hypothetical protein [Lacipirellulaceae bacterium]
GGGIGRPKLPSCRRTLERHAVADRSTQLDGKSAALPLPAMRQVFLADAIATFALAGRQLICYQLPLASTR